MALGKESEVYQEREKKIEHTTYFYEINQYLFTFNTLYVYLYLQ